MEPRYRIRGHLGQSGNIDRFICDFEEDGQTFDAHMLWAPNSGVGSRLRDAAMFFGAHPQEAVPGLLAAAAVNDGIAVWLETSQMLPLSEVGGGGSMDEPSVIWVADQVARLLAQLRTVYGDGQPSARQVHANIHAETIWLTYDARILVGGIESLAGLWPMRAQAANAAERATDSYSFGLMVFELLAGPTALMGLHEKVAKANGAVHHNHAIEASLQRVRGADRLKSLLVDCMVHDPNRRPDPMTIIQRLSSLAPSAQGLVPIIRKTPETAWSWSDSSHAFVGQGNMATKQRGRHASGAVERVPFVPPPPPAMAGESTDFFQVVRPVQRNQPQAAPDPVPAPDHVPADDPAAAYMAEAAAAEPIALPTTPAIPTTLDNQTTMWIIGGMILVMFAGMFAFSFLLMLLLCLL